MLPWGFEKAVMKLRFEVVLNTLIAMILVADVFVMLQIYQQRTEPEVALPPLTASIQATSASTPKTEDPPVTNDGPATTETTGALDRALATQAQESLRGALFGAKAAFVENGTFPTSVAELGPLVPGLQLSDGLKAAGGGVVGMVATESTVLFVAQGGEEEWYCIATNGEDGTTYYDTGTSVGEVGSLAGCNASTEGW